jgi:uncharacterized protein
MTAPLLQSTVNQRHRAIPSNASVLAALLPYFIIGIAFGTILVKSEVVSWYRIQEMFRFQSVHMFGIIGSAVVTAAAGVRALIWLDIRTLDGQPITVPPKQMGRGYRYVIGGFVFGIGWAFTGTCPGPLFALIGSGATVFVVVMACSLGGTWLYGAMRQHLPH